VTRRQPRAGHVAILAQADHRAVLHREVDDSIWSWKPGTQIATPLTASSSDPNRISNAAGQKRLLRMIAKT
jgi:hypothetical protein